MTEAEGEMAHDRYMAVSQAIKELVDKMTADLSYEADEYVRQLLTDVQRYWRD
jgi:hypothetical protein